MTMKPSAKESSSKPIATTTANNNNNNSNSNSNNKEPPPKQLSKRQRHAAGPNPSNTWQQQPRIKSAGARARAYIAHAGLADDNGVDVTNSSAISTNVIKKSNGAAAAAALLLDPQIDLNSPEVKFGRLLGGTDQRKRHEAVKMLRTYLTSRADFTKGGVGFSQLDFLKLWKGLWYTLYMADKAPVQDKLSKILAELMWCLAGTEEEDEYAGEVFLEMEGDEDYFGDDHEEDDDEEEDDDDNFDGIGDGLFEDDDGDTMEIIEMESNSDDGEEEEVESEDYNEEMDSDEDDDVNSDAEEDDEVEGEDDDNEIDDDEQRVKDMNEKHCRGAHLVCLYISTFLCTVRREWGNVDKHRVDKFYTAVRLMISEAYKYMSKRGWNFGIIHLFNDVLYEEGLSAETPGLTNGLRYHLIDICIDELAKVNKDADMPLTEATFLECIEPFFVLVQRAVDKNVQKRVMDNVLLKFLNEYSFVSATAIDNEMKDEEKALIFEHVHVGTVSKFIFQIASDSETDERFRKSLYEMHKTYERKIKAAGRDVDDVEYCGEIKDEVNTDDDCDDKKNSSSDILQSSDKNGLTEIHDADVRHSPDVRDETGQDPATTSSSDKKKRKKKRKKGESKVDLAGDQADGNETEIIGIKESPSKNNSMNENEGAESDLPAPMKSSSKKRRKNEKVVQDDKRIIVSETAHSSVNEVEGKTSIIPSKSPKKHKEKHVASTSEDTSHLVTSHVETPTPNAKKKQKKSPPSVDPRSMHSLDQTSIPSSDGASASPSRRVSFGAPKCKSHKASMKAVKTLEKERWDTRRTPEKGILRPKSIEKMKNRTQLTGQSSSRKKKGTA